MAEFFQAFLEACRPGPNAFLYLVLLSPFLISTGAIFLDRRLQRDVSPPQDQKLLRPPGYSLSLKLDEALESIFLNLTAASIMLGIAAAAIKGTAALLGVNAPMGYTTFFGFLSAVSVFPAIALMFRAWKKTICFRNVRLGMRGEQAVAEVLNELGEFGYRTFHDLQPKGTWNIDHVIVGTRGVFVIETKTRRKRPPRRKQPGHVVIYDGRELIFPSGTDREAIEQGERNASWVRDHVSKKTCELVEVQSIVVIPGCWYVETKGNFPVKVMNANYLKSYLRNQRESVDPLQVRRIIVALDEQCRTLEF